MTIWEYLLDVWNKLLSVFKSTEMPDTETNTTATETTNTHTSKNETTVTSTSETATEKPSELKGYWVNCTKTDIVNKDPNDFVKQGITDLLIGTNREDHTVWGKKTTIEKVIEKYKNTGIRIHAWFGTMIDSNGACFSPTNWKTIKINDTGTILDIVKDFNEIEGLAGIHFDSIRYPGTAKGETASIANFCKAAREACGEEMILTAAVMGEKAANGYYYGQDSLLMLNAGLDFLIPMIYRCTYKGDQAWMKEVMTYFHSLSSKIIAGVCCYNSDDDPTSYSEATLLSDINAMLDCGSPGYMIFVEHLSNFKGLTGTTSTTNTTTTTTTETTTTAETSLITISYTADRQDNAYQCGPSSMKMALSHYGLIMDESWLATKMGTNSTSGTSVANMVAVISSVNSAYGTKLTAKSETFSSWETLRGYLAKGYPVILRVQSWLNPNGGEHYVMMYGLDIDNGKAYLGDPSYGKRTVTLTDLRERIRKVSSASIIVVSK
jgi:predicted double-glycine peptidase